ncbi:MAG: Ig-like domain-containing protein, partial [Flavobacteriaceae bacterium]|nr:Ig-like domain-containing protein [Flavobacteriaceae bacterium]
AADTVINLSPYFSDAENDLLSFSFTNADPSIANVILNTNTLTIQYIPEENGTTTITITVDDSNICSSLLQEVFLVNITAINDPPLTVTDTLIVLEGGTVTQTTLSNTSLLTNDTDTESDALQAIQLTAPTNGTLAFSSTGTFTYAHDGSETTTDSFQYRAAEIALGGQDGNIITVGITIQEVNDCPVYTAVGGFPDANEDGAAWTWDYGAEISDDDGLTPIYTLTHTATSLLTATTDANGIVTFTPKLNQFGTATMTLNVNDRRSCDINIEIPVTINPINDCPTVENATPDVSANEDDPDLIIPLANIFEDIDTTPLNYRTTIGNSSLVATSITATALIIDFLPNQSGSTFINLIALDGDASCTVDDLFTVSITPVNDPPIGVGEVISLENSATTSVLNDGVTNSVLANDSDPEGNAMTAVLATGPINGTLNLSANGNFTYSHDGSATVTDSFTYTPRDIFSNIGNTTTVTIYINNVPVGVTETIVLFESGTATTTTAASTSVLSNDTDADAGDTALLTATIGTSPLYGTLSLNSDGSFTYTHLGSEDFTDSFTYIPFDGKGYGLPTVVSVTISPTNDAPVAFPDSISVGLGQTTSLLTGGLNSVLMNDIDPDGDSITAVLVSGTSSGTLVLNPGGTFSYTQSGVMDAGDSFTYMARDSNNLDSNIVTVNITLTCSPCTEKTIEAGSSGVIINYQGCDCRTYYVYVPKGEVFIFCHLDGMVSIDSGSYTVLSSKVCY